MNNQLTEIICVVDRSGSMASIQNDAIGGFNTFLDEQQKLPGEAKLTLVLFDHEYDCMLDAVPVQHVQPLTPHTYVPRGSTALFDAVGRTIDSVGARLAATPEADRPGQVLVCILTDGLENASLTYSRDRVRAMVEHQQEQYNWQFHYIAANQDAFAEGAGIGILRENVMPYVADSVGMRNAFSYLARRSADIRRWSTSNQKNPTTSSPNS